MPKNPLKGFARRKSSGNVLDIQPEQPAQRPQSTFRVLERPDKTAQNGVDRRLSSGRPLSAIPFHQPKGKSTEDLGRSTNRGSGTTTLSGSSGYYDTSSSSARYSSTSTLPSSFDQENDQAQEELFPVKREQVNHDNHQALQTYQIPASGGAPNPSFSSRASRAMSFGLRSKRPDSQVVMHDVPEQIPSLPDLPDHVAIRDRAMTGSSYASTAVPPRLEANLGASDFSSDFGNMFEGLEDSKKQTPLPPPPRAHGGYQRSDSEPLFPPRSVLHRQAATPSPDLEPQRNQRPQQLAPTKRYSWQSRNSHDGLMSPGIESDIAASPRSSEFSQETVKPPTGFGRFRPGYQPLPVRYNSPAQDQLDSQPGTPDFLGRQPLRHVSTSSEEAGLQDDETRPASRTEPKVLASSIPLPSQSTNGQVTRPTIKHAGANNVLNNSSPAASAENTFDFGVESQNTTPRAIKLQPQTTGEDLFDVSPAGPASRAWHPTAQPRIASQASSSPKKMTRAQFEMQQAAQEDYKSENSDDSEDGYDDGDEDERQAELTRQRRKQEANLAVYRQQMKKVSGGNPSELPSQMHRPSIDRASLSAPALHQGMSSVPEGVADEDDDVPLGILQAHGFPNKNRPPAHVGGSAPPTPGSQAGSTVGDAAGGVLPPFARRLPQLPPDPYFGAGLVNQTNRESLAFGGTTAGSVYGGVAPAVQPAHGGLVGVIAGEERARAARRGSPNTATGGYGPMPLPNNMQQQMPLMMPRSNSMMSIPPQIGGFMPPMQQMPHMPMSPMPMDSQQQMMQMMQMQQQMMQSIIQMQAGQSPNLNLQQSPSMGNGFLDPNSAQRPMSMAGTQQNPPAAGRSMSMMQPPPQWGANGAQGGRSNTMSGNPRPMGYAGSVYNYNLSAPAPGYTPSIAPSERSNIGMPSRYRPVNTSEANGGNSRTQTMTSNMDAYGKQNTSNQSLLGGNLQAPKATIRVIDKPKGSHMSSPRKVVEDEDEDEGWAAMRQKREARKRKNTAQQKEPALSELYTTLE